MSDAAYSYRRPAVGHHAMSWRCRICGVRFDEPAVRVYRENLDGENGVEVCREICCPVCAEQYIEETEDEQNAE